MFNKKYKNLVIRSTNDLQHGMLFLVILFTKALQQRIQIIVMCSAMNTNLCYMLHTRPSTRNKNTCDTFKKKYKNTNPVDTFKKQY